MSNYMCPDHPLVLPISHKWMPDLVQYNSGFKNFKDFNNYKRTWVSAGPSAIITPLRNYGLIPRMPRLEPLPDKNSAMCVDSGVNFEKYDRVPTRRQMLEDARVAFNFNDGSRTNIIERIRNSAGETIGIKYNTTKPSILSRIFNVVKKLK